MVLYIAVFGFVAAYLGLFGIWTNCNRNWQWITSLLIAGAVSFISCFWVSLMFAMLIGCCLFVITGIVLRQSALMFLCIAVQAAVGLSVVPAVFAFHLDWQMSMIVLFVWMLFLLSVVYFWADLRLPKGWTSSFLGTKKYPFLFLCALLTGMTMLTVVLIESIKSLQALLLVVLLQALAVLSIYFLIQNRWKTEWIQVQEKTQKETNYFIKTVRTQRHDFNFHLNAISGMLAQKEYDNCYSYVRKMIQDASDVNDLMPLKDTAIASLLFRFRQQARSNGFDLYFDIHYDLANILCTPFECNKILGNLLQNAIDAVKALEDTSQGIRLQIFKRRANSVIVVTNPFLGDAQLLADSLTDGHTTKRGHEGIGLGAVQQIAQQYGGRLYFELREELVSYVVSIPNTIIVEGGKE